MDWFLYNKDLCHERVKIGAKYHAERCLDSMRFSSLDSFMTRESAKYSRTQKKTKEVVPKRKIVVLLGSNISFKQENLSITIIAATHCKDRDNE